MIEEIGFGIVAAALVFSAFHVVVSQNLVRSVFWLGVTLASTAVLFVMLESPFLAAIQLLLYTGGIITLMLFGVMLTNRETGVVVVNAQTSVAKGATVASAIFGILAAALYQSGGVLPNVSGAPAVTPEVLGRSFLTDNLLAFEVLSILLLAAMIGAIVIARRRDFGSEAEVAPLARLSKLGSGELGMLTAGDSVADRRAAAAAELMEEDSEAEPEAEVDSDSEEADQ